MTVISLTNWPIAEVPAPPPVTVIIPALVTVPAKSPLTPAAYELSLIHISEPTRQAGTITSGVYAPGTIAATQDTAGAAFSFSQSYTQADAVPQSAPTVGAVGNLSDQTSYAAGVAGDLAGTVTLSLIHI